MARLMLSVVGHTVYISRLKECIKKCAPEYMEVTGCFHLEELQEFLIQQQPDILLYEQGVKVTKDKLSKYMVQIQLVNNRNFKLDSKDNQESVQDDNPSIFRYQEGTEILRQIFRIYEQTSQKSPIYRCKTMDFKMTAIYAPSGHEFLLPFSIVYSSFCGETRKVLCFNLTEFSGMAFLLNHKKEGENFSDLIYGIRQKKERFALCLQTVLHHTENFDYVLPPGNPEDLYEIQEEDLACLLALLREETDYQEIVWICGMLNQAVEQILEYCVKVYCVIKESSFGKYRKEEFEMFLKKEARKRLQEKVQYVNPQVGTGGFVQGTDILTQIQNSELTEQVRRLVQEESELKNLVDQHIKTTYK